MPTRLMLWLSGLLYGCLAWLPVGAQARTTLHLATGELPPYATESRPDQGVVLALIRQAFDQAGYDVQYHFMPWSRAQVETRLGRWDGTAYWGKTTDRVRDFWLSDNVLTEQWVFLHRKDMPFDWHSEADLAPYTIAVIPDYTYTPAFRILLTEGKLKGDTTPDDLSGLRKLLYKRVDLLPIERNVACFLLHKQFSAAQIQQLAAHPKRMTDQFTTHLMLSRQRPASPAILKAFNKALAELYRKKVPQQLLAKLNCDLRWTIAP